MKGTRNSLLLPLGFSSTFPRVSPRSRPVSQKRHILISPIFLNTGASVKKSLLHWIPFSASNECGSSCHQPIFMHRPHVLDAPSDACRSTLYRNFHLCMCPLDPAILCLINFVFEMSIPALSPSTTAACGGCRSSSRLGPAFLLRRASRHQHHDHKRQEVHPVLGQETLLLLLLLATLSAALGA